MIGEQQRNGFGPRNADCERLIGTTYYTFVAEVRRGVKRIAKDSILTLIDKMNKILHLPER